MVRPVHAVVDTLRIVLRDTVAVRDTITHLYLRSVNSGAAWIVPAFTASAAIVAALLAQWCAVAFSARARRAHVIALLDSDLSFLREVLRAAVHQGEARGSFASSHLGQMDFLARSFEG